jgi:MFS family permease
LVIGIGFLRSAKWLWKPIFLEFQCRSPFGCFTVRQPGINIHLEEIVQLTAKAFNGIFAPLRNRNLSVYLSGQTLSLLGTFMQATAQSWVVWQVSHSTSALGMTAMLGALPMLILGPFAGAWADRLDRRKVLIGTQISSMILACIFAILLQTNLIQLWHIYMLSAALGCVSALDLPTQSAFIGDLSGNDQVRGAVALNGMVMQASRMVGPALAGWIVGSFGAAPAFWLNGASFITVILSLLIVQSQQVRRPAGNKKSGQMKEAFQFVAREPRILDLLMLSFILTFFGISAGQLLPAIVTDTLHSGAEMLGLITGASGAGALVSSFLITPLVQRIHKPGWMIAGALIWMGAWFAIVVFAGSVWVWVAGMFFGGLTGPVVNITCNGLIQVTTPADMKARMLALWMMVSFGMMPFGFLLVGYSASLLGAPLAIVVNGLVLILGAGALLILRPGLRNWEPKGAEK